MESTKPKQTKFGTQNPKLSSLSQELSISEQLEKDLVKMSKYALNSDIVNAHLYLRKMLRIYNERPALQEELELLI